MTPTPSYQSVAPWPRVPAGSSPDRDQPLLRPLAFLPQELSHPQIILLTGTRADTGGWFLGRRIILLMTEHELALAAPGPKPLLERCRLDQLGQSLYHHVTGHLLLAPAPELSIRQLRLKPLAARRVLQFITPLAQVSSHA